MAHCANNAPAVPTECATKQSPGQGLVLVIQGGLAPTAQAAQQDSPAVLVAVAVHAYPDTMGRTASNASVIKELAMTVVLEMALAPASKDTQALLAALASLDIHLVVVANRAQADTMDQAAPPVLV